MIDTDVQTNDYAPALEDYVSNYVLGASHDTSRRTREPPMLDTTRYSEHRAPRVVRLVSHARTAPARDAPLPLGDAYDATEALLRWMSRVLGSEPG
jgi:hypothetical protein